MVYARIKRWVHKVYRRWIRPHAGGQLNQQRLKLVWDVWGYWPLFFIKTLSLADKLVLLRRFLVIDWRVTHAHKPFEIAVICRALSERPARPGEVLLEAGCWKGGSSAKFSIVCQMLGYRLCIYDSFQGVEEMQPDEKEGNYDFSGQYASPDTVLRENLARYGEIEVCSIHGGWFADTLAVGRVPYLIRVAYIDCDLAKGTKEALAGIVPALVNDGWIFSQDFHIKPVYTTLCDPNTWSCFTKGTPTVSRLGDCLASIRFAQR